MGNDLVKRLKACANGAYREPETLQKYCGEAAARIEALEGALEPLIEKVRYFPDDYNGAKYTLIEVSDLRRVARTYANEKEPK